MKKTAAILFIVFIYTFALSQGKGKNANIADGYGDLKWGAETSKAKSSIKGKLKFTDEKKVIISNDGEIEYYYGFFYMDPAKDEKAAETDKKQPQAQPKDDGRLYYVALKFPYLAFEKVKDIMIKKYGESTGESIKNNQGSISWDSADSVIILWVDRYENNPFCRRITYISKKIATESNDYQNTILNKAEIEILKKLNP